MRMEPHRKPRWSHGLPRTRARRGAPLSNRQAEILDSIRALPTGRKRTALAAASQAPLAAHMTSAVLKLTGLTLINEARPGLLLRP
jgi:hypothetical protein